MAASFTLTAAPQFPQGTVLSAYPVRLWAGGAPQEGDTPRAPTAGSPGTVDAHGFAEVTGLAYESAYYIGAEVEGVWRWRTIRTGIEPVGGAGISVSPAELLAAIVGAEQLRSVPRAGSTHTLEASDIGKCQDLEKTTGEQITVVPANAAAIPDGSVFALSKVGAAVQTLTLEAGVTMTPAPEAGPNYTLPKGVGWVRKRSGNAWDCAGFE